ncbi:MAG: DUF922 domain-containing Zn-dependent protease [Oligoflexia bacterium]|nr:DUF922 domain-containing Zn-dependent protease [Oligoflexia bacterium]
MWAVRVTLLAALACLGNEAGTLSEPSALKNSGFAPKIQYYRISGSTREEIRRALQTHGPVDQFGIHRHAAVDWKIAWSWPKAEDGRPRIDQISCRQDITIILPQWESEPTAPPELITAWNQYYNRLARHEAQHVLHVVDNYPAVEREIRAALEINPALTFAEANKTGHAVLNRIRDLDLAYDEVTQHGRLEGISWD